jgi:hypothetical protein
MFPRLNPADLPSFTDDYIGGGPVPLATSDPALHSGA